MVNVKLVNTCSACPEQYDAFCDDKRAGYLRLRHGHFTVEYPVCGGELIYESYPRGDGSFYDDSERGWHLGAALGAILKKLEEFTDDGPRTQQASGDVGTGEGCNSSDK